MRLAGLRLGTRQEEILDDLATLHDSWSNAKGNRVADRKIVLSALNIVCLGVGERQSRPFRQMPIILFTNHFKLAGRSIRRRPGYAGITIFGLAVGMACCLLILTYARHQWTFDTFHRAADSVFRVHIHAVTPGGETEIKAGQPIGLAAEMDSTFDEILFAAPVIIDEGILAEADGNSFEHAVLYTEPAFFDVFTFPFVHGSKETALEVPESIVLLQNYPNPFNPVTTIAFELPSSLHVLIEVYDILGHHVQTLVDGMRGHGHHEVRWSAGGLPSGVYIYRLRAGNSVISRTLSLIK